MVGSFTIRDARREDAPDIVRLINIAGHGLPLWCWSRLDGGGEDAWQAGRDFVAREDKAISWKNGTVATLGSDVAAVLIAFHLDGDAPGYGAERDHPVFAPLKALKVRAAGTFHLHVLAAYAEYRGRGLGSILIDKAERLSHGRDLSLILSDANGPARRFYARLGFEEADRLPIVTTDDWQAEGENWLLLVKKG
ncbi:GNAT family N-acetyltransferase [Martelella endophytica]|uniref:GNAT family N-acetyltransferase n=1 Tax=Martelella endophytica TaxID=1486262 RepID=UPI000697E9F6|nr:GNAT family N-acetyltransferase [Martelella endophytica]